MAGPLFRVDDRGQGVGTGRAARDLTDEEWARIEPFLPGGVIDSQSVKLLKRKQEVVTLARRSSDASNISPSTPTVVCWRASATCEPNGEPPLQEGVGGDFKQHPLRKGLASVPWRGTVRAVDQNKRPSCPVFYRPPLSLSL